MSRALRVVLAGARRLDRSVAGDVLGALSLFLLLYVGLVTAAVLQ